LIAFTVFYLLTVFHNAAVCAQLDEEILEQVRHLVDSYYVGQIDSDVLNTGTIDELFEKLGDPYSGYMTQEQYRQLLQDIDMEFVGIGVTVVKVPEGVLVTSVFKGSGADLAGLRSGDII